LIIDKTNYGFIKELPQSTINLFEVFSNSSTDINNKEKTELNIILQLYKEKMKNNKQLKGRIIDNIKNNKFLSEDEWKYISCRTFGIFTKGEIKEILKSKNIATIDSYSKQAMVNLLKHNLQSTIHYCPKCKHQIYVLWKKGLFNAEIGCNKCPTIFNITCTKNQ